MHLFQNILNAIRVLLKHRPGWKNNEYFNPEWEKRVAQLARHIPVSASVMDLGCGTMTLKKYLHGNLYYPVDYTKRDNDTIICDFNKSEFPTQHADVHFISGCLEYIDDPSWFINSCCRFSKRILLSYCTTNEFPSLIDRANKHWKNNLSRNQIISLFKNNRFTLLTEEMTDTRNHLFVFIQEMNKSAYNSGTVLYNE